MSNQQQSYFEQAMTHLQAGNLPEAQRLLQEALALGFDRPEIHNNLANIFMRQGHLNDALKHYAKAVQLKPDYLEAHFNLGLLFLKQTNVHAAITQFNNVIRLSPEFTSAHFYLGTLYFEQGLHLDAIREFQIVLQIEPFHIAAHNNLGVVYLKTGEFLNAIRSFSNVLRLDEKHWEARSNLAAILLQLGRYAEASRQYEELLKFKPEDLDACYNLGVALMPQGRLEQAVVCFETILKKQPEYWDAHINLAAALLKLDRTEQAIVQYQKILQHQPDHPFVSYLLQALTGKNLPSAAPAAYVQHLFDNYASYFDEHVKKILHYETPEQLKQLFVETTKIQQANWNILDLGCGTGLSGVIFRDFAKELTGVDLSSKMLAVARSKNIYNVLLEGDMLNVLRDQKPNTFDLILAADVFVYVGDLTNIFQACHAALKSAGYFLFSTETLSGDEYILQKSARYAHSKIYIENLAQQTGFSVMACKKSILRKQDDQPLEGSLYLLTRVP